MHISTCITGVSYASISAYIMFILRRERKIIGKQQAVACMLVCSCDGQLGISPWIQSA
jgi:hypothetical protein